MGLLKCVYGPNVVHGPLCDHPCSRLQHMACKC